jgi:DNA-directed RNA polymerase I, II, and III subunit RPABC3
MCFHFLQIQPSLLDEYEYAMHGKIFQYRHLKKGDGVKTDKMVSVFASFGGLLMCIKGTQSGIVNLERDMKIFVLIKKI